MKITTITVCEESHITDVEMATQVETKQTETFMQLMTAVWFLFLYNLNNVVVVHLMAEADSLWTVLNACSLPTLQHGRVTIRKQRSLLLQFITQ